MDTELTLEDIERHRQRHGAKGTGQLLNVLGLKQPMYNALTKSEPVKLILKNAMGRMDELLDKIIADKCSTEEKYEYGALKKIFMDWASEIDKYNKLFDKLKGGN